MEPDDFSYITNQNYTCNTLSFVNFVEANVQITKEHLETISKKGWLDITLVYYYTELVKKRDATLRGMMPQMIALPIALQAKKHYLQN